MYISSSKYKICYKPKQIHHFIKKSIVMKHLIIIISTIILFAACKTHQKAGQKNAFAYQLIAQSTLHGNGAEGFEPGLYKITDKKQWQEFLKKINKVNNESDGFKLDHIDFDKYILVAIFDKILHQGGVKFYIKMVENTKDTIKFVTDHKAPQGQFAIQVMNQPYILIKIKKTGKKLVVSNK